MKASKLFAAVAVVLFAGSASAADLTVANAAAISAAAATQSSYAVMKLNVPVVQADRKSGVSRADVKAEAVAAAKADRSTFSTHYDFLKN